MLQKSTHALVFCGEVPQADGSVQVRIEGGAVLPANVFTAYEHAVADENSNAAGDEQLR